MLDVGHEVWDVHAEYDGSGFRMFFYIIKYTFKKSHISKSNFSRLLRDDGSQK